MGTVRHQGAGQLDRHIVRADRAVDGDSGAFGGGLAAKRIEDRGKRTNTHANPTLDVVPGAELVGEERRAVDLLESDEKHRVDPVGVATRHRKRAFRKTRAAREWLDLLR